MEPPGAVVAGRSGRSGRVPRPAAFLPLLVLLVTLAGCFAEASGPAHGPEFPPSTAFYDLTVNRNVYDPSLVSPAGEVEGAVVVEGVVEAAPRGSWPPFAIRAFFDVRDTVPRTVRLDGFDEAVVGEVVRVTGPLGEDGGGLILSVGEAFRLVDADQVRQAVQAAAANWSESKDHFLRDFGATDADLAPVGGPLWHAGDATVLVHHDVGAWSSRSRDHLEYEPWVHVWYRVDPGNLDHRILAILVPPAPVVTGG